MIDKEKIAALKSDFDKPDIFPSQLHFFNKGVDKVIELAEDEISSIMKRDVIPTMLELISYCHTRWMSGPEIPEEMTEQIFDDFLHRDS